MQYEGTLYRPPSEARSLIIQVTIGCAHNRCTFCNMYREKKFRVREKEEIMRDLDECRAYYGPMVRRVFFADGDALVVKTELLLELLDYVHKNFPAVERIAAYGTAKDVLKKSEEDLKALAAAGLELIYLGAESGDDRVLEHIKKDVKAADIIAAGQKLKRCGLQTSVTLISGLGGRKGIRDHAIKSAELITGMNAPSLRGDGDERGGEARRHGADHARRDRGGNGAVLKECGFSGNRIPYQPRLQLCGAGGKSQRGYPADVRRAGGGKGRAEIPSGGVAETYLKDRGAAGKGRRTPGNPFAAAPGCYRLKTAVWAGVSFSRTMEAEAYVTTSRHSFV